MDPLWIALIAYGVSVIAYAFRVSMKYFQYLEGQTRNGTIITQSIAAGIIWPITFVVAGVRDVWSELAPVKVTPIEVAAPPLDPTGVMPDLSDVVARAAAENLGGVR